MSVKILTAMLTSLDTFCQHPLTTLDSAEQGAVAVLDNNIPVLYALTPQRMAELLASERVSRQQHANVMLDNCLYSEALPPVKTVTAPAGKFPMYQGWQPDVDFLRQAAVWGVMLTSAVTSAELASFVTYWQAEGRVFHHVQWQQKLARSVQLSRTISVNQQKRDINHLPESDHAIPDGFRG